MNRIKVIFSVGFVLIIVSIVTLVSLYKQDPNQISRKNQQAIVKKLVAQKYDSYDQKRTQKEVIGIISGPSTIDLNVKQKEALIQIIDGFFMTYSLCEFETYLRFKQSQGAGHYGKIIVTNGMDTLDNWRNRWEANNGFLRLLMPNLPSNFRQRIVRFDATSIEIDIRKIYGTNVPAIQISTPTNHTGSAILKNECFVYDINPETLSSSNQAILWATWKFPCYTEAVDQPGFVVVSAYWNEPAGAWTIHCATSALPPYFFPLL